MTTRFSLTCFLGAALVTLVLSAIYYGAAARAAEPPVLLAADAGSATDSASAPTPPAVIATGHEAPAPAAASTTPPSEPTVDDVEQLWRSGSVIGAIAVALFLGLTFAARVDPRRAFYWTSGLTAVGVIVDAVLAGATPTPSMIVIAITTLVALLARGPLPTPPPAARTPEKGSAAPALLVLLAIVGLAAAAASSGCASIPKPVRAVASDVVDCTTPELATAAAVVERVLKRDDDGSLNWAALRDLIAPKEYAPGEELPLAQRIFGCASVLGLQRALEAPANAERTLVAGPRGPSPEALRAGFDAVRRELLGGRRFLVATAGGGTVL